MQDPLRCAVLLKQDFHEFIELEKSNDFQFGGNAPFTIELWIMPMSQSGEQVLVSKYNRGKWGQYFIRYEPAGEIFFHREVAPWGQRTGTTLPAGRLLPPHWC